MKVNAQVNREQAVVARVPVDRLRAHPRNVRKELGDLRELAESIRYEGALVPLMAERRGHVLQLLHGHRRWAAARLAGVATVPVVIVPVHAEDEAISLMLAENVSRADLTNAEKWAAVAALHELGHSYSEIAERLGVSVGSLYYWRANGTAESPAASPAARPSLPRRPRVPRVPVSEIHGLLARWRDQVPEALAEELTALVAGWEPPHCAQIAEDAGLTVLRYEQGGGS